MNRVARILILMAVVLTMAVGVPKQFVVTCDVASLPFPC